MHLKSLELKGFKSFAKKAELEFKTSITAIVGPNGSGKSNVAEAFRFALGEQRMTQMRTKRTEDLIFNGTPKQPRANRARVTLTFDNTDGLLDVDFDEVEIERVIHRDASTDYKINGSTVRLKDITELLAGAHIGASGHHIISQGETDRILNVSPKERKSVIEDALGLKIFHHKKDESLRKLEKTEQNIKEVESLRREIKPHLKFLKGQVEKVEKAHAMREELSDLYADYLAFEKYYLEHEKDRLTKEKKEKETALSHIREKLREAEEVLATLAPKEEATVESQELKKKLQELRLKKDKHVRELGRIEGALTALGEKQKGKSAQEKTRVSFEKVKALQGEIAELVSGAESADDSDGLRVILKRIQQTIDAFIEGIDRDTGDIHKTQELKQKKEDIEASIGKEERQIQQTQKSLEKLEERVKEERESLHGAERDQYELKAQKSTLQMELAALGDKLEHIAEEQEELTQEGKEARSLVQTLKLRTVESADELPSREEQGQTKKKIERLKIRLEDAGAGSGEEILEEYREVEERDHFLKRELTDLKDSAEALEGLIDELDEKLQTAFAEGVRKINTHFNELFTHMFGGGSATLSVVQERHTSEDEFDVADEKLEVDEGVELSVNIPRKRIRGLEMLSGGERALTSIALLFAMSQVNPPPFLVLDETDAALDEANSRRYGDLIEKLAEESQLILITHNRETMSRAGVLYGVTMGGDGVSQLLSVDFEEAVKVAK